MGFLVIFGMCIVHTLSHLITSLDVPEWVEPGRSAELRCQYSRQLHDPPLHSVKWYRGKHEIFRYTPQELEIRYFNGSGVSVTNHSCDHHACVILVRPERGTAKYTCEVSSEGPRFAVDRKTANMTLAVLPQYDPLITDLPTMIFPDEQAFVNCTSDYSLPPATLQWFVDDQIQQDVPLTHVSGADGDGLRASWRTIRVAADPRASVRGYMSLRCTAIVPTRPRHVRSMAVRLIIATRPHISHFTANSRTNNTSRRIPSLHYVFWTLVVYLRKECLR